MQASSSSRSAKTREKHTSSYTYTTCGTTVVPIEIENKIVNVQINEKFYIKSKLGV
jgi:hypothetical protein